MKSDSKEIDAFSDPSIRAAFESPSFPSDYNPFVMPNPQPTNVINMSPDAQPKVIPVVQKQIEAFKGQQVTLNAAASDLRNEPLADMSYTRVKNFPPIPSFCPFEPCFRQDIHMDIPVAYQKWARYLFYLCLLMQVVMVTNFGSMSVYVIGDAGRAWRDFVLSILWLLLIGPCSYVGWFRPIYNALRDDSSMNFMLFFFMFFIHLTFVAIMLIGIPHFGFAGFAFTVQMLSSQKFFLKLAGFFGIVTTIGFIVIGAAGIFLMFKIYSLYATTNGSLERAQQELVGAVWSNETARRAASTIFTQSTTANTTHFGNQNNNTSP
ncbi:hypothetical protein ACOME3_008793 [Neoechinorhynchus agilis]